MNISSDASGNLVSSDGDQVTIFNMGDIAFVLCSTSIVWIMVPGEFYPNLRPRPNIWDAGVGFFYSGLLRRKNALSMIYLSMATLAVVSVQWCGG